MVQRKAPTKISSQAETKRSHVKLERQTSSQKHQDTRSRGGGGGGGGGGDLKKKMKLERSIRAADLEGLKSMKPKKQSSPNYMKPTSSSDARKERLQVKPSPKNSDGPNPLKPKPPSCPPPGLKLSKSLSRQSSLKAIRPLVNRATCSSTLKDSNFPRALDLNPEGTSVMKVCPYTYCSLNGHRHEPLPPLRSFIKARRKLIKTQKSMKLKGLSSWRGKGLGKDKGEIDTGQKAVAPSAAEEIDDFFVGVYTNRSEDGEEDQIKETCEVASVDDGLDKRSELPDEEVDVTMSSLEYVERDRRLDDAEDEEKSGFVSKESENEEPTLDFNWEGRVDNPCSDNLTKSSECPDDRLDLMPPQIDSSVKDIAYEVAEADIEKQQGVDQESAGGDEFVVDEVGAGFAQEVSHKVIEICDDMIRNGDNLEGNDAGSREELCRADVLNQESTENGEELVSEESEEFSEAAHPHLKLNDENIKEEENKNENEVDSTSLLSEQIQSQTETTSKCDDATKDATISSDIKSYSYTRRKMTDEQDEIREFNPRAPRFLDVEPDPEAEKVDLRHQMMDERKNSEEYLIDYALRRAVTKLDPARKKKVALLVEAFETVMPYKKSLRHKTSGFIHARIMQACS